LTTISEPEALVSASNVVFFSQSGGNRDKVRGVYYDGAHWTIFNEDTSAFLGAFQEGFHVLMFPAPIP
jgi:hypothetical protein